MLSSYIVKFSIVTPSFNQGQFISQTIDSVIGQKGDFEIEYFVMDGGSSDQTVDILKTLATKLKNNPRIKFYWQSQPDKGQVDAINQGFSKATGDVLAFINSDDYYLPDSFNLVYEYFKSHPKKEWLIGNCRISDPKLSWTFFLKHLWPIQYFKGALYVFNTINQPSVFIKKSLIKKVGVLNPNYNYAFDYDYWLRCLQETLPSRIFKDLSVFRIHSASKGNTNFQKQFEEDWQIFISRHPLNIYFFAHAMAKDLVNFIYRFLK